MEDKLIGSVYDYKRALNRIANCRGLGFPYVKAYINQELRFLPECCFQPTEFSLGELRIDHVANRILKKCGIFNVGTAYQVNARGNCLFNAVAVLLNGDETLAAQLRVRTCIEMTKYRSFYETLTNYPALEMVSPSYERSCLDCASHRKWSSIWTLIALSSVLKISINSGYPPMNGKQDYTYQVLNFTINPREQSNMSSTCLSVMWSCDSYITNSKTWTPNHFAPLLKGVRASPEFDIDNNEDRGRSDDNGVRTNYDVCKQKRKERVEGDTNTKKMRIHDSKKREKKRKKKTSSTSGNKVSHERIDQCYNIDGDDDGHRNNASISGIDGDCSDDNYGHSDDENDDCSDGNNGGHSDDDGDRSDENVDCSDGNNVGRMTRMVAVVMTMVAVVMMMVIVVMKMMIVVMVIMVVIVMMMVIVVMKMVIVVMVIMVVIMMMMVIVVMKMVIVEMVIMVVIVMMMVIVVMKLVIVEMVIMVVIVMMMVIVVMKMVIVEHGCFACES